MSEKPEIVRCVGLSVDVLKTLHKKLAGDFWVHYPFTFLHSQFEKTLMKPSYSVMRWIDMLARLRQLLPLIVDCLDVKWMQSTGY